MLVTNNVVEIPRRAPGQRLTKSSTRDPLAALEKRVSRVEVKVTEDVVVMEDLGTNFNQIQGDVQGMTARLTSLEIGNDGLREELVALINNTISNSMSNAIEVVKETVQVDLAIVIVYY
ncbi:unnamed protein product [Linum trigynum]|uniref:Uncharacterized protein n=1 Tax=Linum trigynum TaxID=586398 RepID=A0AAV2FKH1_9ROSI